MENIILETEYRKPEEYANKGIINVSKLVQDYKKQRRKPRI